MPGLNNDGHPVSETPIPPPVIPISHIPNSNHTNGSSSASTQNGRPSAPSFASTSSAPVNAAASSAPPTTQGTPTTQASRRPPQSIRPSQTPQPSRPAISTPVPPPTRPPQISQPTQPSQSSQPSHPERPLIEPLTPPLNPMQFPPPRQTYTYTNQPAQTITAAPPTQPIDFDSNPDVLALKSAMSILQMQSKRAQADMVALQKAKDAALAEPVGFISDLTGGKIRQGATAGDNKSFSSSSDDEEDGELATKPNPKAITDSKRSSHSDAMEIDGESSPFSTSQQQQKPWTNLPAEQNIYRCPPINWSQYAIAGESLEKLHNEQLRAPAQGTPATLTADGRYEFKSGPGRQEEIVGIAAPYNPLRDRIDAPVPRRKKEQQQQQPPKGPGQ